MSLTHDSGEDTLFISGDEGDQLKPRSAPIGVLTIVKAAGSSVAAPKATVIDRAHFTLGRSGDCNLVLADARASRIHAQIVAHGGKVVLEDLGSANGTFVNSLQIKKRVLESGDLIRVGETVMRYQR